MKHLRHLSLSALCLSLLILLAACGPNVSQIKPPPTVTVNPAFQSSVSPVPTVPTYRCGAWSLNNTPGANSNLIIFARLTKDIIGVGGATATATIHFKFADQMLDQQTSDEGGYVMFTYPLGGQQPSGVPATVSVTFTNIPGGPKSLDCTEAFFSPM